MDKNKLSSVGTVMPPQELTREYKIRYINDNINVIGYSYRKEILQMIIFEISPALIKEKGNGTQVKFEHINDELLTKIYKFIYNKIETNNIAIAKTLELAASFSQDE
jgi:hypothetical protein